VTPDSAAPTFAALVRKPDPVKVSADAVNSTVTAAVPATLDVGTAPAAALPCTVLVPLIAETVRASAGVRLLRWARGRMADAADYQRRHRTFWHAVTMFITRPPETWAETEEHLRSRKWLQEWMTGKFRVFCEWENIAWGHLVSMPAKAVLQNIEKAFFERQAGFWLGLAGVLAGFLAWYLSHLGH
jgi:hypothetical protein